MNRLILSSILAAVVATPAFAQDETKSEKAEKSAEGTIAEQLAENPNDTSLLNKYMNQKVRQLGPLMQTDPKAAAALLDEMIADLEKAKPDEAAAVRLMKSAKGFLERYKERIKLAATSLEDLEKKLSENPDDVATISSYVQKVAMSASMIVRSKPDEAEKQIKKAKEYLAGLKEKAEEDATKTTIDKLTSRSFARIEQTIEGAKKLAALVGTDAVSLKDRVGAWVNGTELSDADLKGKVVLLDFWAVWCGPCIGTFPHLREWHEKYAEKGLVIVGLTNYYNYTWDDETGRHTRSQEEVAPEAEQAMLEKFCESHKLHHRIALQTDRELASHYAVSGIPHVVVIDRQGKVQMIRVGSGEANANDIGGLIEKLIGS